MGSATNSSFLALILKEFGATSLDRFKLISLCNVSYKIMAKIIANQMTPLLKSLILPNQGGFVAGRKIWDNFILVQESIIQATSEGNQVWKLNWIWKMFSIE
jgi:hypothetical protein